ncbi:hypothetical protein [Jeotgalibacillus haloalkalitolerans]|uniref:SPOR domain-containing protein n=1 Tax=Jeotgalibacillus haloalkalitolerans TaxID=3104292 RepID=A0ABU5KKE0_9BACL|nr:hypothetical protein [Jeotgalibacillus sp. HH7-29]MDZ5711632.1 hypothetical protein [Jeotgalibacillus sp. HH7-29]
MLTTVISRIREEELLQAVQDLKDRGFEQQGEIVREFSAPKRFSSAQKKRFKFEENDQCVMYRVKMVKTRSDVKKSELTQKLEIHQHDIISLFKEALRIEEAAIHEADKLWTDIERERRKNEALQMENDALRKVLLELYKEELKEQPKVYKNPLKGNYPAYTCVGRRKIEIGRFDTEKEAKQAEINARGVLEA